ncbi:hypothetical protein NPIL_141561 [Nephila pilipes]|uniref:Uncharacterized protein n=1 Tax=Nephila pilipes TaxID=299642 RepID=A0A8X6NV03_NEPPI|nr:hypothetical protein NPIL_141561 [Nephila pilipes]
MEQYAALTQPNQASIPLLTWTKKKTEPESSSKTTKTTDNRQEIFENKLQFQEPENTVVKKSDLNGILCSRVFSCSYEKERLIV